MKFVGKTKQVWVREALIALGLVLIVSGLELSWVTPFVFGVAVYAMNALLLHLSARKADQVAEVDAKRGMLVLYISAVVRFVWVGFVLLLGIWQWNLQPEPMVIGFVLMTLQQFVGLLGKKRLTD